MRALRTVKHTIHVRALLAAVGSFFDLFIPEEDLISARLSLLRNWIKQGLSKDDAEDLAQAGLLRGLINLDKFRGEASIKTWLIAVGKNEGYTYLRKQSRQVRIKQRVAEVIDVVARQRQSCRRRAVLPIE